MIVGIPNAETTPKGQFAITHESQALLFSRPVAWNSFTFLTMGLMDHLEASISLNGLSAPRAGVLSLGAGFKWILPLFSDVEVLKAWELKLTFGTMALFSLDKVEVGGWGYSHASTRIPITRTRVTAGVSYGSEVLFGPSRTPVSLILGLEQPITDWFWVVADWYSGEHALSAFIPAVQFNVWRFAIIAGYKFDNVRQNPKDAVILEVMFQTDFQPPAREKPPTPEH